MKLTFEIKKTWGNEWYYPICHNAKFICGLMDRKALRKKDIAHFEDHGWATETTNKTL